MAFVVRILLIEPTRTEDGTVIDGPVHAEAQYEYSTLELAREAEQMACNAAAGMKPSRSKATSDEDWTEHPDRSDAADV
jgi:hypothetical protein